ncbi:MAG: insulinase family protein, partial [Myxococcales bacterium]|nr:insulinase family protein [Myxococcales bacterium]
GEPSFEKIPVFGLGDLSVDSESHSDLFRAVVSLPAPELEVQILSRGTHFEVEQLPTGLLYRSANPSNDLFQLSFRRYLGSAFDPALAKGMDLWTRAGVGELDLEGFRRALFHAAAAVSIDVRRQQSDLTLAGRAAVLPQVLPLLADRLRAPVLGEEERSRWATDIVGKRKQRRDTTDFKFAVLEQWALRGDRSPYLCEALSNEQVLGLSLDELRAAPGRLLDFQQICFYAGPHLRGELLAILEPWIGDQGGATVVPPYQPQRYATLEGTRIYVMHHEAAQAKIGLLLPGEPYDPARSPVYRLFHEYVGGQAGLIFQEVREARGLAYSAHGGHSSGARMGDQNLFWAKAGSRPDRAVEVVSVLLNLLRELPAQERRFERARGSAIEAIVGARVRFRGYGFTAEGWRLRGLDEDPRPRVLAELHNLGLAELLHFAEPLEQAGAAVVIVGDRR